MATDPTTLPTIGDIQQAKKDMTDINKFVVSEQDAFTDNTGKSRKTLEGLNNDVSSEIDRLSGLDNNLAWGTVQDGIDNTVDGDYFSVVSPNDDNYLDLYKNNAGVAEFKKSYPSNNAVLSVRDMGLDIYTSTDFDFLKGVGSIANTYYNAEGTTSSSPTWDATPKFKVSANRDYTYTGLLTSSRKIHIFDSAGNFIRVANPTNETHNVFEFTLSGDEVMLGISLLQGVSDGDRHLKLSSTYLNSDIAKQSDLLDIAARVSDVDGYTKSIFNDNIQLLDESAFIADSYYKTGGTIGSSPTWKRTPLIPIEKNTNYVYLGLLTSDRNIHLFNADGDFISDVLTPVYNSNITRFNSGDASFIGVSIESAGTGQVLKSESPIVNDNLISTETFDIKPYTKKGGNYKLYQAVIKNPLDFAVDNTAVGINVNFNPGDVHNESCIELVKYVDKTVPDVAGTGTVVVKDFSSPINCQFSPDVNDNLKFENRNDGYHSDGSLKNGKVYFYVSMGARAEVVYYLRVYSSPVYDGKKRIESIENPNGFSLLAESPNNNESFELYFDKALTPLKMLVDGVDDYAGKRLFYSSATKGDGSSVLMQPNAESSSNDYLTSNIEVAGSGRVFNDINVNFIHKDFTNLKFYYSFRFWANGLLDINSSSIYIDDQKPVESDRIDTLTHRFQYPALSGDTYKAIGVNNEYIPLGHYRFSVNKTASYSVAAILRSNTTQSTEEFSPVSDISNCAVSGNLAWVASQIRNLKTSKLGKGAFLSSNIGVRFSSDTDDIIDDGYHYTKSQKLILNSCIGSAVSLKNEGVNDRLKKSVSTIVNTVDKYLAPPSNEGFGSYAQHQLAMILSGSDKYTIDDVLDNYELMREQFRGVGLTKDYFESYFGLSLVDAQTVDDGSTYYPPLNPVNSARPFATQKLGRDFHIVPALIWYFERENLEIQNLIDEAQRVIDNAQSSANLKAAKELVKEELTLKITDNLSIINGLKDELKILADACVLIVKYSNRKQLSDYTTAGIDTNLFLPKGRIALQWKPSPLEPFNGSTAIMRFLSDAITILQSDIERPNWQAAYSDLRYYVTSNMVSKTNVIPYGYDRDISIRNYLHYSMYTMFDFVNCEKSVTDFDPAMQLKDHTLSGGLMLELSSATNNRRGQTNTYMYAAYILIISGFETDKALAANILSQIENICFSELDTFSRVIALNGWISNETLDQQNYDVVSSGTLLSIIKELVNQQFIH